MLVTAATWRPAEWLARWIESGADVNASNATVRKNPLLTAVTSEAEDADTLKLLLERWRRPERAHDGR
jgi:hypothetical protein